MYDEVEILGAGGFAQVVKVRDEQGHLWTKKIYCPQESFVKAVGHEHLKARFVREVSQLSYISHPNVVSIADFRLMTGTKGDSSLLKAIGRGAGTTRYSATVFINNFKRATAGSDIYSFGAILHEFFRDTQRIPYDQIRVDGKLGEVINRCTKKNPRRRYATVEAVRAGLYDALKKEQPAFTSKREADVVALIEVGGNLSDDQSDDALYFMDTNESAGHSNDQVFRSISTDHIHEPHESAPELFACLSRDFCYFVYQGTFDFDYCDVLADKLGRIFDLGNVETKSQAGNALLEMCTIQNRWHVECRFIKLFDPNCQDGIAARFVLEAKILKIVFAKLFVHLLQSISASKNDLHPLLRQELS